MKVEHERRELWWAAGLVLALAAAAALALSLLREVDPPRASALGQGEAPAAEGREAPPAAPAIRAAAAPRAEEPPSAAPGAPEPALRPLPRRGVAGTVRDAEGRRVPGLQVDVRLELGARSERLGRATTDASGAYALELDLAEVLRALQRRAHDEELELRYALEHGELEPELLRRVLRAAARDVQQRVVLRVEAGAPACGWGRAARELGRRAPPLVRIDLRLDQAAAAGGRVFHRSAPVPGALVQLFDADWNLVDGAVSDPTGSYRLGVPEPGSFHVHARALDVGASGNSGFSLGEGLPFPEVDLDIDGHEVLRGRVVLPDGEPVPGLRVEALQYGLWQGERFNGRNADHAAVAQAEAPGGLCASEAQTGPEGRFEMSALQRGSFALRVPSLRDEALQPDGIYATGGEQHELVLDVHLLVVEVHDRRRGRRGRRGVERLHEVEILCRPDETEVRPGYRVGSLEVSVGADLGATFVVEPGASYLVAALARGASALDRVTAPTTARVKRVRLQLREDEPELAQALAAAFDAARGDAPGALELRVRGPDGAAPRELRVTAQRPGDGALLELGARTAGGIARLELAPGVYALEVADADADGLVPLRRERVRVESGATAQVEGELAPGGRIQLKLGALGTGATELAAESERARWLDELGVLAVLRPAAGGGPPARELVWTRSVRGRTERAPQLLPGDLGRSEALAPGEYVLELRARILAPRSLEVSVRAGETTELTAACELATD